MKRFLLMMAATLVVGCSTTAPEQRCRDKSDATASISYDYCVWNKKQLTSNDRQQRTTGEWYSIVAWPSSGVSGSSSARMPASSRSRPDRGGDRIFK